MSDELEFGLDLYTLEDEDGVESTLKKLMNWNMRAIVTLL